MLKSSLFFIKHPFKYQNISWYAELIFLSFQKKEKKKIYLHPRNQDSDQGQKNFLFCVNYECMQAVCEINSTEQWIRHAFISRFLWGTWAVTEREGRWTKCTKTQRLWREAFWNIYFKVKKNQIIKQLNQILPLLLFLPEHNLFKLYASVIWNYTDHSSLTTLCELALAICPC